MYNNYEKSLYNPNSNYWKMLKMYIDLYAMPAATPKTRMLKNFSIFFALIRQGDRKLQN